MNSNFRIFGFSTFLLIISLINLNAQCPPDGGTITMATQADVDTFVATYPDCTVINSALYIGNSTSPTDITDISGLNSIIDINGYFTIINTQLTSLTVLENLAETSGVFRISTNPLLTSLGALSNLVQAGFNFTIYDNDALTSLVGLGSLTTTNALVIEENGALTTLEGLDSLTSIPQLILAFTPISTLEDLNLSYIGYLSIYNTALTDFTTLDIDTLNQLELAGSSFTSLDGLEEFTEFVYLGIYDVSFTTLVGLENLNSVIALFIG